MTPREIAQTDDLFEAFAAIYTDPEMMAAWLQAAPTLRDKMDRARHTAAIARDPRHRFGLDSTPVAVQAVIEVFTVACELKAHPARVEVRALRAKGLSWGEVWSLSDAARAAGFRYGRRDSFLLGVADAEIDPALAARLASGER